MGNGIKFKQVITLFVVLITACSSGRTGVVTPLTSPTLAAVSTQDVLRLDLINKYPELAQYDTYCMTTYCYGVDVSPDGKWIYMTNFNTMAVFKTNGQKVGQYSFYDVYGHRIDFYEGYINGVHWTQDGKYLYLAAHVGGDGGPEAYLDYRSALIRLSLEDGTWQDLNVSGSFKISPNDDFIIYSNDIRRILVKNVAAGQEDVYPMRDYFHYFGKYVWSPDSQKVVFVATSEHWDDANTRFALFITDFERDQTVLLFEDLMLFYYPVAWVEDNKVALHKYQEEGTWTLDLSTDPPTIYQ